MARRRRAVLAGLGACAALLAGCGHTRAGSAPPDKLLGGQPWLLVPRLAFKPQAGSTGCGPAALAMVLGAWGVTPPAVVGTGPPGRGVSAGELRDAARASGLSAFVFPGTPADLILEIKAGRPVVVGLARRRGLHRYSHFVVLAGRELGEGKWLLADPDRGWKTVRDDELLEDWTAAGRTTLVVFPRPRGREVLGEKHWTQACNDDNRAYEPGRVFRECPHRRQPVRLDSQTNHQAVRRRPVI